MSFKKYNSIDNSNRVKTIDNFVLRGYTKGNWVVTCKIHGANFSFIVGKDSIECAKRSGVIKEDESFFNYKKILERYADQINKTRDIVVSEFDLSDDAFVQIFGEIFGGHYPHPDVPRENGASKVQDKVWYCPDIDFIPFDIYVRDGEVNYPLDHDVFERIAEEAGFGPIAKALFTGSFSDCLDYPNEYEDPTHKYYNLPKIEDNTCEGNVLKPIKAACMPSGERVILKNKNEKFTERKVVKQKRGPTSVPPEVRGIVELADEYINENRLRNVISHIGEVTNKDFGKIMGMFAQDVLKDMVGDNPDVFDIEDDLAKRARKVINQSCSGFIRTHFLNIIDGTF